MSISRSAPRELWQRLQSDAGLELRLTFGRDGRDADLERAVFAELVRQITPMQPDGTVDALLKTDMQSMAPSITTETLLVAVLASQRGFSAMMRDILQTLIDAQAQVAEHALSIEFDFDKVEGPIRQTLEQFREQVERIEQVLAMKGFELPDRDQRWVLARALGEMVESGRWLPTPDFPAAEPRADTAYPRIDGWLAEIDDIVDMFQRQCLRFGPDRPGASPSRWRDPSIAATRNKCGSNTCCLMPVTIGIYPSAVWSSRYPRMSTTGAPMPARLRRNWTRRFPAYSAVSSG